MLNKKGQVGWGLSFLLKLFLFMFITAAAVYIFNNVALADIRAQNAARDVGTAFDVIALSLRDVTLDVKCPSGIDFTIDGAKITALASSSFGQGFASYSYMHESNAVLPEKAKISCALNKEFGISKKYDSNLVPALSLIGVVSDKGGGGGGSDKPLCRGPDRDCVPSPSQCLQQLKGTIESPSECEPSGVCCVVP